MKDFSIAMVQLKKVQRFPEGGIENIVRRLNDFSREHVKKADLFSFNTDLFSDVLRDYDFVHFTISPFQHKKALLKWYLLGRRIKSAITYYNYSKLGTAKNLIKKRAVRSLFDFVIVHSKRTEKIYKEIHPETHFLNPPVTKDFFNVYKKRAPEHISFIGRFSRDKGVDRVLGIKNIVLCGYSTDISAGIPELISRSKAEVTNARPIDILRKTSVMVLPYRSLNYTVDRPLIVLEAMAAGVPVLTTGIGDLPYILPEECIMKKGEDMRKKIKYLQKNFDSVGKDLHERAMKMGFSIEKVGPEYIRLIEKATSS